MQYESVVQSAQNVIEITPDVAVGVCKSRDILFCFIRNPGDVFSRAGDRGI